jgi:hypothetical protein
MRQNLPYSRIRVLSGKPPVDVIKPPSQLSKQLKTSLLIGANVITSVTSYHSAHAVWHDVIMVDVSNVVESTAADNEELVVSLGGDVSGTSGYTALHSGASIVISADEGEGIRSSTGATAVIIATSATGLISSVTVNSGELSHSAGKALILIDGSGSAANTLVDVKADGVLKSTTSGTAGYGITLGLSAAAGSIITLKNAGSITVPNHAGSKVLYAHSSRTNLGTLVLDNTGTIDAGASGSVVSLASNALTSTTVEVTNSGSGQITGSIFLGANSPSFVTLSGGKISGSILPGENDQLFTISGGEYVGTFGDQNNSGRGKVLVDAASDVTLTGAILGYSSTKRLQEFKLNLGLASTVLDLTTGSAVYSNSVVLTQGVLALSDNATLNSNNAYIDIPNGATIRILSTGLTLSATKFRGASDGQGILEYGDSSTQVAAVTHADVGAVGNKLNEVRVISEDPDTGRSSLSVGHNIYATKIVLTDADLTIDSASKSLPQIVSDPTQTSTLTINENTVLDSAVGIPGAPDAGTGLVSATNFPSTITIADSKSLASKSTLAATNILLPGVNSELILGDSGSGASIAANTLVKGASSANGILTIAENSTNYGKIGYHDPDSMVDGDETYDRLLKVEVDASKTLTNYDRVGAQTFTLAAGAIVANVTKSAQVIYLTGDLTGDDNTSKITFTGPLDSSLRIKGDIDDLGTLSIAGGDNTASESLSTTFGVLTPGVTNHRTLPAIQIGDSTGGAYSIKAKTLTLGDYTSLALAQNVNATFEITNKVEFGSKSAIRLDGGHLTLQGGSSAFTGEAASGSSDFQLRPTIFTAVDGGTGGTKAAPGTAGGRITVSTGHAMTIDHLNVVASVGLLGTDTMPSANKYYTLITDSGGSVTISDANTIAVIQIHQEDPDGVGGTPPSEVVNYSPAIELVQDGDTGNVLIHFKSTYLAPGATPAPTSGGGGAPAISIAANASTQAGNVVARRGASAAHKAATKVIKARVKSQSRGGGSSGGEAPEGQESESEQLAFNFDGMATSAGSRLRMMVDRDFDVWGKVTRMTEDQRLRVGYEGYNSQMNGMSIGFDYGPSAQWKVGLAFNVSETCMKEKQSASGKRDARTYLAHAYANYTTQDHWFTTFVVGGGFDRHKGVRFSSFGLPIESDYLSYSQMVDVSFGKHITLHDQWKVTPSLLWAANRSKQASYQEVGEAHSAQFIFGRKSKSQEAGAEVQLTHDRQLNEDWSIKPELTVGWRRELLDKPGNSRIGVGGATFLSPDLPVVRNTYDVGVGVELSKQEHFDVALDYNASVKTKFVGHMVAAKLTWKF